MCITQIWQYRECGCHYHHRVPCSPSLSTNLTTTPRRLEAGSPLSSAASSSSEGSPTSPDGCSTCTSNNDSFPVVSGQCSIRDVVHKTFLDPICDDCLLEELGLQPELGPLLGGQDLREGLYGEEWLL